MHVVLERIAMEPQKVPPVANLLGPHVEARRQPRRPRRVVGVTLQPLRLRQPEELLRDTQHGTDHVVGNAVVLDLPSKSTPYTKRRGWEKHAANRMKVPGRTHRFGKLTRWP